MRARFLATLALLALPLAPARADEQASTPAAAPSPLRDLIDAQDRRYEQRFKGVEDIAQERDKKYAALRQDDKEAVKDALSAANKAVDAALQAAEKAVTKAEAASEKRFEGVNEFRKQLNDQAATFLPRSEYDAQGKVIASLATRLEGFVLRTELEAQKELVAALTVRMAQMESARLGTKEGISGSWDVVLALIGVAGIVFGIVVSIRAAKQGPREGAAPH